MKRDRLWFLRGVSVPAPITTASPAQTPRFRGGTNGTKVFAKLNWKLTQSLQMMQSFHQEAWVNPTPPTLAAPFVTTQRVHATVPNMTFADVTHVLWDTDRLGGARRPLPSAPGRRSQFGRPHDALPYRSDHRSLER